MYKTKNKQDKNGHTVNLVFDRSLSSVLNSVLAYFKKFKSMLYKKICELENAMALRCRH